MKRIKEDVLTNQRSGPLTMLFLINVRIGQRLLTVKLRYGAVVWLLYVFPVIGARLLNTLFGCSVPFSVILGRRVLFKHGLYGFFVSGRAVVGDDCEILHQVTIGAKNLAPRNIGNGFFINVDAKIIGDVQVKDWCKIGVQALVVRDAPDNHVCKAPVATMSRNL
jgi:serine O-acetyltransferase